ncbi:MAG: adenylate/guanylate cyclase domain-containing protein [Pseudomonadota bacterium]
MNIEGDPLASEDDQSSRIAHALAREEQAGFLLVLYARFVVLTILLVWAIFTARPEYAVVYAGILFAFAALGVLPLAMHRYGMLSTKWMAGFMTIDVILLTIVLMVPGSMFPSTLTPQFNLQLPGFLYLCLFVVGMAVSYSPALVLWTGFVAIVCWSTGMIWIANLPDSLSYSFSQLLDPERFTDERRVEITSSRLFVSLSHWYNRMLFLGLVTLVLAIAVWRSRRMLRRQIIAESARANLSRYFSPNMVDRLSTGDTTLEDVDTRNIAVLFVDIVGFTEIAERLGSQQVIKLLREFHGRIAHTIFDHGGTIDKYIGDAVMANFGSPETGKCDATDALRCAYAIIDEVSHMNAERQEKGLEEIQIGIGIHYGEVVTGNIGDSHHLEYAVLGDTVNLASRLERLTRKLQSQLVVSDEFVTKVKKENDNAERLLRHLIEDERTKVRGRSQQVSVWKHSSPQT